VTTWPNESKRRLYAIFFWELLINVILLLCYKIWFSNLIERLVWTWPSVCSVGSHIRVWNLLRYIILFSQLIWDLGNWLVLLWPLVGTEKVGNSHLTPSSYIEALICYYICFVISRVVNSFWRYGNWSHTISIYFYFIRWIIRFSKPEYVFYTLTLLGRYRLGNPNCPFVRHWRRINIKS
jgi:hypothetical protein